MRLFVGRTYSLIISYCASICHLLRWGAMDAEAYQEEAKSVLHLLWSVSSYSHASNEIQWAKPRISALQALMQFEVALMIFLN